MSHWVKLEHNVLKNTDKELLEKALSNLGFGLDHSAKQVSNAYGKSVVEMALTQKGKKLSVGFVTNADNCLELKGDFWKTGINGSTFLNELAQQYNKERIVSNLGKSSQYFIEQQTVSKNGEIELLVACY